MNYLKSQPELTANSELLDRLLLAPDWHTWNRNFDEYVKSAYVSTNNEPTNGPIQEQVPSMEAVTSSPTSTEWEMDPRTLLSSSPKFHLPLDAFIKVESATEDSYYVCNYGACGQRFSRRGANANSHWIRHQPLKPYVCYICSEGYSTLPNWNRHCREQHNDEYSKLSKMTYS
jgi:hypothetical protein